MTFCIVIYIYIIYIFFITQIHNYSRNTFFFTVLDSTCVGLRVILCVLPSISLFISVFIKYHNFWAKLRYINIFRKNYLKHVVKNNYIIKPFSPHNILDISHSEQGWVGACGSYALLCHFVSFFTDWNEPSTLWGRVWHKMATGATASPPGKSKTKDSGGRAFAPGETSDALRKRSGHPVERRLEDTSRVRNKDRKPSSSLGACVSPEGVRWTEGVGSRRPRGRRFARMSTVFASLTCFAAPLPCKSQMPNNNQPPIYLQTTSPSADTFSNYVSMHAWD